MNRERASVEDQVLYIGAKIYWVWFFGRRSARLERVDEFRLGLPKDDMDRAAVPGNEHYWNQTAHPGFRCTPTGRLIREFRAGVFPGLGSTPVAQVQSQLTAPRYNPSRVAFDKATDYLSGEKRDLENAVKEAATAAESLGKIVLGLPDSSTLNDVKDALLDEGLLDRPLNTAFDALAGYRNTQPGVAHGGTQTPDVAVAESKFALNMAAAIALFLLEQDTA